MYGDIIKVSENCLLVEGLFPESILREPDTANMLLYHRNETLYLFDTGATQFFRERILDAIKLLPPFKKVTLFNTHFHPDHTGNNDIILSLNAQEIKHYMQGNYRPFPFAQLFSQGMLFWEEYFHFLPPGIPALDFADLSLQNFKPLCPSNETITPLESLPLQNFVFGGADFGGWEIDGIQIIKSSGHSADHCMYYLPELKLLVSGDETFPLFPLFPDASSPKISTCLKCILKLCADNQIDYLIDGHSPRLLGGKSMAEHVQSIKDHHQIFENLMMEIITRLKSATAEEILAECLKIKNNKTLEFYWAHSFPRMPIDPRALIVLTLLSLEVPAEGEPGAKKFFRPE